MKKILSSIILLIGIFVSFKANARSFDSIIESEIKKVYVERDLSEKDIILLGRFMTNGIENARVGNMVRAKIKSLLLNKPNVTPIFQEDMNINLKLPYNYEKFKKNNISYIINGVMQGNGENYTLVLSIIDVYKATKILEQSFNFKLEHEDKFIKQLTTQVYEFLTGEFGFFYGKLLYTTIAKPGVRPFKKIVLSEKKLDSIVATSFSNENDISFNPRYCKQNKEVFFVSQKPKYPSEILIASRINGSIEKLNVRQLGLNKAMFSPSISKNCNEIVFSVAENGMTNLYLFNRTLNSLKILTPENRAINTSPHFFDNDSKIVFVSDVSGKPRIWKMEVNGKNKQQITIGEGAYYSPSVSSDGKKLAFIKVNLGKFYLGISNLDGTNEELLYSSFLIENPSWTPIGKTIIFSMKLERDSKSRVYAISLNGREPEVIDALSGNLNEPLWIEEF